MSNFTAFNLGYLETLVEPFLPGGTEYITPVKFEAITPDIFAFLFRTTGNDNVDHFFVALEYDHLNDAEEAQNIITRWHGSFKSFWTPESDKESAFGLPDISVKIDKIYYCLLAEVDTPTSPSYWTDHKDLYADEDTQAYLKKFPEGQRDTIRRDIEEIRKSNPDANISVHIDDSGSTHYYFK